MPGKVLHGIAYPFPNFNGCTIEVWEWTSNSIPHFIMNVITNPCWDLSQSMVVKGAPYCTPHQFTHSVAVDPRQWSLLSKLYHCAQVVRFFSLKVRQLRICERNVSYKISSRQLFLRSFALSSYPQQIKIHPPVLNSDVTFLSSSHMCGPMTGVPSAAPDGNQSGSLWHFNWFRRMDNRWPRFLTTRLVAMDPRCSSSGH